MAIESEIRLAECEACGNRVSTQARTCPACGHPAPGVAAHKVKTGRVLIGSFIGVCLVAAASMPGVAGLALLVAIVGIATLVTSLRHGRAAIYGGYAVLGVIALLALSWTT